ncbi:MAG: T9SS type A sorting domain-containing protein [Mariniphaga sp.]
MLINNDITISTQEEVDKYANNPIIGGNITITGKDVQSLESWNGLRLIKGSLRIEDTSLKDLSGLENLTEIDGNILITNNKFLETLGALDKLDSIANDNHSAYYLQVDKNPVLVSFCGLFNWAKISGNKLANLIASNGFDTNLEKIVQGKCEPDPIFLVKTKEAFRLNSSLHVSLLFSLDIEKKNDFASNISLKSKQETLALTNYNVVGKKLELYFSFPKYTGKYDLLVNSQLQSAIGLKLNQNQNGIPGEITDSYNDSILIGDKVLMVTKQYPVSGLVTQKGFTEVSFNTSLKNEQINNQKVKLIAPNNAPVPITIGPDSIRKESNVFMINYQTLPTSGKYRLIIYSDAAEGIGGEKMDLPFEGFIETPFVNLTPQKITLLSNSWESGSNQSLSYTVKNGGTKSLEGNRTDVVYLSSLPEWNSNAIEIYRSTINQKIDSLGTAENNIQFKVPNLIDGRYYLLVRCNVDHKIAETDFSDNTFLGKDTINLSVPQLIIGAQPVNFVLNRNEQRLYKLPMAQNQNVRVVDSGNTALLSVAGELIPDINSNKQKGTVIISNAQEGNYYILVSNDGLSGTKNQSCFLSAKAFDLEITQVYADTLLRYKTALVPVEIIGCSEKPVMYLIDKDGNKIKSDSVMVLSENLFSASFRTDTLTIGKYDLYAICARKGGIKEKVITLIDQPVRESLKTNLIVPSSVRPGATVTIYVEYMNNGNVDIPAPLLILKGKQSVQFRVGGGEYYKDEIHLMGLNALGVLNRLKPGEGGKIPVEVLVPNDGNITSVNYSLHVLSSYAQEMANPFYLQWLNVNPSVNPEAYSQTEWVKYTTNLRKLTGFTWSSFIDGLSYVEGYLMNGNNATVDAKIVYEAMKELALNDSVFTKSLNLTKALKLKSGNTVDYMPGTLFIWNKGWQPLVENYLSDNPFDLTGTWYINGRNRADFFDINKPTIFIAHGMNNDITDTVAIGTATKIDSVFPAKYNIIAVDWGWWSKRGGFDLLEESKIKLPYPLLDDFSFKFKIKNPLKGKVGLAINPIPSANKIPEVSRRVVKNLNLLINGYYPKIDHGISLKSFASSMYMIGHSHGAHVCGLVAESLVEKPNRITALDASEDFSHSLVAENLFGSGWGTSSAQFVDYYKSSFWFGTERLVGHDNFILLKGDGDFRTKPIDELLGKNHGNSVEWFIGTIDPKKNPNNLGFYWTFSSYYKLMNNVPKSLQWTGVINGSRKKIECLNLKDELKVSAGNWHYSDPWYKVKSGISGLDEEWNFQRSLAKVIDYDIKDNSTGIPMGILQEGKSRLLTFSFQNRADNYTIPKNLLEKNLSMNYVWITTENLINTKNIQLTKFQQFVKPGTKIDSCRWITVPIGTYKQLGGNGTDPLECIIRVKVGAKPEDNSKFWDGELYISNNVSKTKVLLLPNDVFVTIQANGQTGNLLKFKADSTNTALINLNETLQSSKNITWYKWSINGEELNIKSFSRQLAVGEYDVFLQVGDETNRNTEGYASNFTHLVIEPYEPNGNPVDSLKTPIIRSRDPNEKVNRNGAGGKNCLLPGDETLYTIYFENDPKQATASAQEVKITDTLDSSLDLSTFSINEVVVANVKIPIPSYTANYSTITDLRPGNNLLLKTEINLDVDTRTLTAKFTSLDPETGEITSDPWAGFLAPNDSTHRGEGHISYKVNLKNDLTDNYVVQNNAKIYFDNNEPMVTNTTTNQIDKSGPASKVNPLPTTTTSDSVLVSWSGKDIGSGVSYFDIYVSENNGNYKLWKSNLTTLNAQFYGIPKNKYKFYSIATDSIGFSETPKLTAEAEIQFKHYDITAPVSYVKPLPASSFDNKVNVEWSGKDDYSDNLIYTVYVSENGGSYSKWLVNTSLTNKIFQGTSGKLYSFFVTACDEDGNCEIVKSVPEASIQLLITAKTGRKWNDVIVCDNKDEIYNSYQWYKNDIPISGATKQYYQEVGGLKGNYYVKVTTADGRTGYSKGMQITLTGKSLVVYPSPTPNRQEFNIEINALESDLLDAKLSVSTMTGAVVIQKTDLQQRMTLDGLPGGVYLVQVRFVNGESITQKLMVH